MLQRQERRSINDDFLKPLKYLAFSKGTMCQADHTNHLTYLEFPLVVNRYNRYKVRAVKMMLKATDLYWKEHVFVKLLLHWHVHSGLLNRSRREVFISPFVTRAHRQEHAASRKSVCGREVLTVTGPEVQTDG
jgi:hypothetical protein